MSNAHWVAQGDVKIAYRTFGNGPVDILVPPFWFLDTEALSRGTPYRRFIRPLASFARVIAWDPRGVGLSDPLPAIDVFDLSYWVEDARAVMNATNARDPVFLGVTSLFFALGCQLASEPTDISRLVGVNLTVPGRRDPQRSDRTLAQYLEHWGTRWLADSVAPTLSEDEREALASEQRRVASPRVIELIMRYFLEHLDVSAALGSVHVPTLIVHSTQIPDRPAGDGRYISERLPRATLVEIEGRDTVPFGASSDEIVSAVARFTTGTDVVPTIEMALKVVLFTDIVGSTKSTIEAGDARWRDLIEEHDRISTEVVRTFGGDLVKSTGDGVLAVFSVAADAVSCALVMRERLATLGLQIRAGCHVGDVALHHGDVTGTAVNIAARVCDKAADGAVFATQTVADLLIGSDLQFADRATHELSGVPGAWRLLSLERRT